jgi:hypothetical protein
MWDGCKRGEVHFFSHLQLLLRVWMKMGRIFLGLIGNTHWFLCLLWCDLDQTECTIKFTGTDRKGLSLTKSLPAVPWGSRLGHAHRPAYFKTWAAETATANVDFWVCHWRQSELQGRLGKPGTYSSLRQWVLWGAPDNARRKRDKSIFSQVFCTESKYLFIAWMEIYTNKKEEQNLLMFYLSISQIHRLRNERLWEPKMGLLFLFLILYFSFNSSV